MPILRNQINTLTRKLKNFRDESGSTTVEFVLWVPMFVLILALTVDVSLLFLRQSNIWQVARVTARQVSIRAMTPSEAEEYASATATIGGDLATATINIINGNETAVVRITVPISDVGVFGVLNIGGGNDLVAVVLHRMEPL